MSPSPSQSQNWFTRFLGTLFGAPTTPPPVVPPSRDVSHVPAHVGTAPHAPDAPLAATPLPYRVRADFLSAAEAAFLHVLQQAVGEQFWLCPKVNLNDLFFVPRGPDEVAFRNRIAKKHVDVVLCDRHTLRPQLAIELDDRSHERPDRVARDVFVNEVFATAQLPLLRVPVQRTYNVQHLATLIEQALPQTPTVEHTTISTVQAHAPAPNCLHCGSAMVLRQARRGQHAENTFYGCPNYPRCRGIVTIAAA